MVKDFLDHMLPNYRMTIPSFVRPQISAHFPRPAKILDRLTHRSDESFALLE